MVRSTNTTNFDHHSVKELAIKRFYANNSGNSACVFTTLVSSSLFPLHWPTHGYWANHPISSGISLSLDSEKG